MTTNRRSQRGQTLVLFTLMAAALIGGLAIVIDVGNIYLTRRVLQNVADQAALVGAQQRATDGTLTLNGPQAIKDARIYATKNGVISDPSAASGIWSNDPANGVKVNWPPAAGSNHAGDGGYLEVFASRTVKSFFAGIFGANPVRVEARAVARGFGDFGTAAVIALMDDPQAIKIGGSSTSTVVGSVYSTGSVFANSGSLDATGWVYAQGTVDLAGLSPDSQTRVLEGAPPLSDPKWPTPTVSGPGQYSGTISNVDAYGWKYAYPGTFTDLSVAPSDKMMFYPGVYYITKSMKISGIAAGFTDLAASGGSFPPGYSASNPPVGLPVCFVLKDGVTFEIVSGATAHFRSAQSFTDHYGVTKVADNLIIRSEDDHNAVKIVGQGAVHLEGTVYAPAGDVQLAGGSGGTIQGQLVAGRVELLGGTGPAVIYDPAKVPATRRALLVE